MTIEVAGEVVEAELMLSGEEAEEFDSRFQAALGSYAEARQELIDCIEFVRSSDVAERLGFKARGDYIADRVKGLNVKWAVEDRRSLVELMAHDDAGGMSTRQIGDALGVGKDTAARDISTVANATDEPRKVESSDGRTRTYAKSAPREKTAEEKQAATLSLINDLRGPWRKGITHAAKNMNTRSRAYLIEALEEALNDIREIQA